MVDYIHIPVLQQYFNKLIIQKIYENIFFVEMNIIYAK